MDNKQVISINDSIFREYDIRGIFEKTLFEEDAKLVGKAFATFIGASNEPKSVIVERDARLSSPTLIKALIEGLIEGGAEVFDIGVGPTPELYFATYHLSASAGIMITGSHNPGNHNGFKFIMDKKPFFGEDIKKLAYIIKNNAFKEGVGKYYQPDKAPIRAAYLNKLAEVFVNNNSSKKNSLKIAWDPGNGAAGEVIEELVKILPGQHILLNTKLDGTFPNHHPDPSVYENLKQLIDVVQREDCDLGVAFDGDADRVGAVDKKGRMVGGDQLIDVFACGVLSENPGATIIADVKASQTLFDRIKQKGGIPLMWKTGHSLIKSKMKEVNSIFAGEMSGHIFFADKYYGFDDGIYAAVRLIDIVSRSNQSFTEIVDELPVTFSTPEIRIDCFEERKFKIIEEIKDRIKKVGITFSDIDGIRVTTEQGWWLIRASNTQAAIVARCEGKTEANLDALKRDLIENLAKSGVQLVI